MLQALFACVRLFLIHLFTGSLVKQPDELLN